jgi:hypothetical protein
MVWVTAEVDVDLSAFDNEDIREEYASRNLGGVAESWQEEAELTKAYLHHHNGDKDKAYEILWQMCLIKLNKVV